jgi:glycosyltransferase involved in cell wall biosynthesis
VFVLARIVAPDLLASAVGIGVAAAANFLVQDRLVFRARRASLAVPVVSTERPSFGVVNGTAAPRAVMNDQRVTPRRCHASPVKQPATGDGRADAGRRALARVGVVIPVYNEERVLPASIHRLHAFLAEHLRHDWRIVIADNASTDQTLAVAGALGRSLDRVAVLHLDQKGRGRALKAAWLGSDADVVSYMDVDLSTDLGAYPALVGGIIEGRCDVAAGRRLGTGARVEHRRLLRESTSRGHNLLIALAFRPHFTDAQCGFKALSRQAARDLLPRVENDEWFFDTELLLLADKRGYRITQIPVHWVDDPDSRVNVTKTAIEDLKGLWRLKRTGLRPG